MSYLGITAKTTKTFTEVFGKSVLFTKPVKSADLVGLKMHSCGCIDSFVSTIRTNSESFAQRIKALSADGYESETLKKLYTPAFKPKRRFNEQGFPITTLIDRKTGEPVEAYIKDISKGDRKKFLFYIEGDDFNRIGRRSLDINRELRQIDPGYMESYAKERFLGIGVMSHQLAVEEAMMNGFDTVNLNSVPEALKFHKKSLYVPSIKQRMLLEDFKCMVKNTASELEIPEAEVSKGIPHIIENGVVTFRCDLAKANIDKLAHVDTGVLMELTGERLKLWQDMAKSQPILLP